MPGGMCAAGFRPPDFQAAARCGRLAVRVAGIPMSIGIGGFAEAQFPERTDEELQALSAGDRFEVQWERAVFFGRHPLLGKIIARLKPRDREGEQKGFVESSQTIGAQSFFPAMNRNVLNFSIELPRFGLRLDGQDPIINSAEILRIPPYGHVYDLEKPVRFASTSNGVLSRLFGTTIETCSIKLVELSNLKVRLVERDRTDSSVRFDVALTNETSEEQIQVAWMVWPNDDGAEAVNDTIDLTRRTTNISFAVPSAVLREQRWFAVAITKPFTTEAAHASEFPLLP
jgi:hypothetical protein